MPIYSGSLSAVCCVFRGWWRVSGGLVVGWCWVGGGLAALLGVLD